MVVSPEPEAPRTPEPQEAEQKEDVNQERVLALDASGFPREPDLTLQTPELKGLQILWKIRRM